MRLFHFSTLYNQYALFAERASDFFIVKELPDKVRKSLSEAWRKAEAFLDAEATSAVTFPLTSFSL